MLITTSILSANLALASSTEWNHVRNDIQNTGYSNAENVPDLGNDLGIAWQYNVQEHFYDDGLTIYNTPVVDDGKVYFSGSGGDSSSQWNQPEYIYCLNANSGLLEWKWKAESTAQITALYGKTYAGSSYMDKGGFYCLDGATGEIDWKKESEKYLDVCTGPKVFDGYIFVGTDKRALALRDSGGISLNFWENIGSSYCPAAFNGEHFSDKKVFFISNSVEPGPKVGHYLHCYRIGPGVDNIDEIWDRDICDSGGRDVLTVSDPVVSEETKKMIVYVVMNSPNDWAEGFIFSYNVENGEREKKKIITDHLSESESDHLGESIVLDDINGRLYIKEEEFVEDKGENSRLYCFDINDNFRELWRSDALNDNEPFTVRKHLNHPIVSDGKVYAGFGNTFYCFDAQTGEVKGSFSLDQTGYFGPASVVDRKIFVSGIWQDHGRLYCLDTNGNLPPDTPEIHVFPDSVIPGETYSIKVSSSDRNGDNLDYRIGMIFWTENKLKPKEERYTEYRPLTDWKGPYKSGESLEISVTIPEFDLPEKIFELEGVRFSCIAKESDGDRPLESFWCLTKQSQPKYKAKTLEPLPLVNLLRNTQPLGNLLNIIQEMMSTLRDMKPLVIK